MSKSSFTTQRLIRAPVGALALGVGILALVPARASVIVVSNNSSLSASTYVTGTFPWGDPPSVDSESASLQFPEATAVPGAFGDAISVSSELRFTGESGSGASLHNISADASASLSAQISVAPDGTVTLIGSGGAYSGIYRREYSTAKVNSSATLNLILELDRAYTYSFATGRIDVYRFGGFSVAYIGAELGSAFYTDTYATNCDLGCASLPPPATGSFSGELTAGRHLFKIFALQDLPSNAYGGLAFNDARLVLTPTPVPIPAAAWLLGSAVGLLAWMRRRAS